REFLETSLSRARFEIISANVFDVESGDLLTRLPWVKIERGALRIGVIGTLGSELISENRARELGIRIEDPIIALGRELPKMRATCDLVILLAHTAEDRLELLLETRPDVDLVIQGHGAGVTTHPQIVGGIPWVQNCDRGKYMARLDLILSTTGVIVWAEGKKTPLAEEIGENEEVIRLIEAYREKLKTLPVPDLIAQGGPDHVGAAQCKSCHSKEHAIWQGSRHRDGLDSLASKNSDYDPECLACHTTGYRLPGGFLRREETPDRGGVQCEACHGPGSDHVVEAEEGEVAPYGKVEQDHCFVCHDSENSPHFQFDIYWAKIKHGPN
ncbi:MAG: multiheme c-type cytochrome, partial [Planctomycetota bacterium]|nr:multiheme c-type cytochrome [Planctomycetota bacterium]